MLMSSFPLQVHYPFENKKEFEDAFPADFIAEGIDQTRGWFYTLLVISTALFGKPPFKNLIVNGLVLAEDGQKMSKRKKNYPDPLYMVDKYGADALRLYLTNRLVFLFSLFFSLSLSICPSQFGSKLMYELEEIEFQQFFFFFFFEGKYLCITHKDTWIQ